MDFLTLLKIIFIAIVEGITEWLPVSANGFSKIPFARAQATGRRENAGAVLIIRARHEAIRTRLGSFVG